MTIKFELPSEDALVLKHIGTALTNIAAELRGDVVDTPVEPDTTSTQYESLSADGANVAAVVEPVQDNTPPPPPASESTPDPKSEPATDAVEKVESADAPVESVELDINGLPWDGRIHSANKTRNADDSWRNSRKPKKFETDEEWKQYIESVESELKGALGNTDDTPPPPVVETVEDTPPPPPVVETVEDTPPPPPVVETVEDTPFDQAVTADVPPPPATDVSVKTFPELMKLVTSNAAKGSVAKVQSILAERDLGSLQTLNTARPDMVSTVYAELEKQLGE